MQMTPSCTSPLELTQPPSHLHHLCADRKSTPPQHTSEMLLSFFVFRGQWLAPTCRLSSGTLPQFWLPPAGPRWCRSPPPPGSAVPAGGWADPSHNPNPQPEHVAVPSADIHSTTIDSSSSLYYYVVACRFELFLFVKRTAESTAHQQCLAMTYCTFLSRYWMMMSFTSPGGEKRYFW